MLVSVYVGRYGELVGAIDLAPRSADYVARVEPIARAAQDLANRLNVLDGWMRDVISAEMDPSRLSIEDAKRELFAHLDGEGEFERAAAEVRRLADGCAAVISRYGQQGDSRGRPTSGARRRAIQDLQAVFQRYARGTAEDREQTRRGAFRTLSPREKKEFEFVRTALRDAGILIDDKGLTRILALSRFASDEAKKGT